MSRLRTISVAALAVALTLACGGGYETELEDKGAEVFELEAAADATQEQADEGAEPEGAPFERWQLWSDCASYCKAVSACGLGDGSPSPMMCQMGCDVAAQWEGQPMPDEHSRAIREQLICAVQAADCAALEACLTD